MAKSDVLRNITLFHLRKGVSPQRLRGLLGNLVSLRTIWRWAAMVKRTGKLKRKKIPGRPKTVRTRSIINNVRHRIRRGKSQRQIADDLQISRKSIQNIIGQNLHQRFYICRKSCLLTPQHKRKRRQFCRWADQTITRADLRNIMFSDEKNFVAIPITNRRNSGVYAHSRTEADAIGSRAIRSQHPTTIMVWLGITWNGLTQPIFFERGEKLNARLYIDKVLTHVKREGDRLFQHGHWTYQQDGAPAHRSGVSQRWCQQHLPNFWKADVWPPNSPDLNPMDYGVWGEVMRHMKRELTDWNEFKREIQHAIDMVSKAFCQRTLRQWLSRVHHCKIKKGGYIDDLFK
jgi:transposase